MNNKSMIKRAGVVLGLLLSAAVVWAIRLAGIPQRLAGVSDAAWWSVGPWVILVLIWIGIGSRWWKHYRGRREGQPTHRGLH